MKPAARSDLRSKYMSAEDALAAVAPGHRVFVGSGVGAPSVLIQALIGRSEELAHIEVIHLLTYGPSGYVDLVDRFRHNALFIGPNVRKAVQECRADYTPVFLSEIPALFRSGSLDLDVALIQVAPPDANGFCSLGVAVDVVKAAVESARIVIAEVNPRMPRTLGDSFVHVSDLDRLVEVEHELPELTMGAPDDVSMRIGHHVASLIEDGSTLQMGIGTIPNAVLQQLTGKNDLGIHTEMFSDGVLPLIETGVITCSRKTLDRGRIVTAFVMGTRKLYDAVHDNPFVEFHPVEYANDPFVIARQERMVAINSCIEVDLTGQVCSDSIGNLFFSGIGGQVDFIRGAARSRGGQPIIALPSTAKSGTVTRIVPALTPGAGVVTTRGDIHTVVTEYGVAQLHGRSVRERVMALIEIAHPDFRDMLLERAKELGYVPRRSVPGALTARYPERLETTFVDSADHRYRVRPLKATDVDLLRSFYYSLSAETLRQRFLTGRHWLTVEDLESAMDVDYDRRMAMIVLDDSSGRPRIAGVGRWWVDPATNLAEVALVVGDGYQKLGIGTFLMRTLRAMAEERKLDGLTGRVLGPDSPAPKLARKLGLPVEDGVDISGNHWLTLRLGGPGKEARPPHPSVETWSWD